MAICRKEARGRLYCGLEGRGQMHKASGTLAMGHLLRAFPGRFLRSGGMTHDVEAFGITGEKGGERGS
jgi:hypothetical protein